MTLGAGAAADERAGARGGLRAGRPVGAARAAFRLSHDLPPGAAVSLWLPRFRSPPAAAAAVVAGAPGRSRWTARLEYVNASATSSARPGGGGAGVVLVLQATGGLRAEDAASVAVEAPALLPPRDRHRPYDRGAAPAARAAADAVAISTTDAACPLPPTPLGGAPAFGLQEARLDLALDDDGARFVAGVAAAGAGSGGLPTFRRDSSVDRSFASKEASILRDPEGRRSARPRMS